MADMNVNCPACTQIVRVPDSMQGMPVQCPRCYARFLSPRVQPDGTMNKAVVLSDEAADAVVQQESSRSNANGRRVRIPAIIVLIAALIGAVLNGMGTFALWSDPDQFRQDTIQQLHEMAEQFNVPAIADNPEQAINTRRISVQVFLGVSILAIVGMIAALMQRFYILAVIGSLAGLFNVGELCCCLSFIPALWLLILLQDPNVVAAFRTTAPRQPSPGDYE